MRGIYKLSFNSIIFVLFFLPASVLGYYVLSLTPLHRLRLPFLIMMSLIFYGRAQISYIPLLLGSIIANYLIAAMIVPEHGSRASKATGGSLSVSLPIPAR